MKIRVSELVPYEQPPFTELANAFVPSEAVVSLTQDVCGKALCTVKEGDTVVEGQIVAAGSGLHSSAVHSPIPGKVSGFVSCSMPDGRRSTAIKIKLDGEFSLFGKPRTETNWKSYPPTSLRRLIADSGIVNTFDQALPLAAQIDSILEKKPTPVVVVRMFDKDPTCCTDRFIAQRYQRQVIEGACVVAAASGAVDIVVAYPSDFFQTKEPAQDVPEFISLSIDTTKYPCGGSREIIQAANRKNSCGVSLSTLDLFLDSSTAFAVYEAAMFGQPVVDRIVQVSGHALAGNEMLRVRVGTSIRALAAECGGFIKPPAKIIVNGLLSGTNISDLDTPITKYVKSVVFMTKSELPNQKPTDCIRCGRCRNICPSGLVPDVLYSFYRFHRDSDREYVKTASLCSGCVLCNSVCPSRLPLCQTIAMLKGTPNE